MRETNTAELYFEKNAIALLIASAFVFLCVFPVIRNAGANNLLILLLCFLPFIALLIYYLYQFIYYRTVKLTDIQTVKLDRVDKSGVFNIIGLVGFSVDVIHDGHHYDGASTKHVFVSGGLFNTTPVEDYAGKTKRVGYNAKRDEWIVLVC